MYTVLIYLYFSSSLFFLIFFQKNFPCVVKASDQTPSTRPYRQATTRYSMSEETDLNDVDDLANLVPGKLVDVKAELPFLVVAHGDCHILLFRLVVQARA
jgi:hypothetical protein